MVPHQQLNCSDTIVRQKPAMSAANRKLRVAELQLMIFLILSLLQLVLCFSQVIKVALPMCSAWPEITQLSQQRPATTSHGEMRESSLTTVRRCL